MPLYEVHGYGRDTGRKRKKKYEALDEEAAIFKAGDDGTIVETVKCIGFPERERARKTAERLRKRVLRELEPYGTSAAEFESTHCELKKRFGHEPKTADVAWALYGAAQLRSCDPSIFFLKAGFLRDEGRDPRPMMQQYIRSQVRGWAHVGSVVGVKVMAAPNCCPSCKAQDGRMFDLKTALNCPPIPCLTCTTHWHENGKYPWCQCDFTPVMEYD